MGGTPDVLTGARGTIYGLTMHTTPADIYRAILEGLTFEMQYNLEKLAKYNIHPTKLFAAGGGAKSPVWRQIKADILNAELLPTLAEEAGALGSAILGLAAATGEKRPHGPGRPLRPLRRSLPPRRRAPRLLSEAVPALQGSAGI